MGMSTLTTGELLTLAATQMRCQPSEVLAAVLVTGKEDGSVGLIATEPMDAWTVVGLLAAAIDRIVGAETGFYRPSEAS
jgi:hypothetical protein